MRRSTRRATSSESTADRRWCGDPGRDLRQLVAPVPTDGAVRGHAVQTAPVLPQHLSLRLVAQRKLEERFNRTRELGVTVWIVGGEHQVVIAEPVHVVPSRSFVGLDAEGAVRAEVLRRSAVELGCVLVADPLPVLVE